MAYAHAITSAGEQIAAPRVRRITPADLMDALRRGWDDFSAVPSHAVFLCIMYPIIGFIAAWVAFGYNILPLLYPMITGFALVGPVAALGDPGHGFDLHRMQRPPCCAKPRARHAQPSQDLPEQKRGENVKHQRDHAVPQRLNAPQRVLRPKIGQDEWEIIRPGTRPDFLQPKRPDNRRVRGDVQIVIPQKLAAERRGICRDNRRGQDTGEEQRARRPLVLDQGPDAILHRCGGERRPALVFTGPLSGVKEQVTGIYAARLAEAGYVIISIDNRGTPAPRGTEWRKIVYGTIGDLSSKDQAAAVRALIAKHSYLDGNRVGVWGWSGGGTNTLNLIFRSPALYKVGMAVAPPVSAQVAGGETVTLDGSASSDIDGTIDAYEWSEGATPIATGEASSVVLGVGVHTLTLTVTDDDGATDADTVVVTVGENRVPTADNTNGSIGWHGQAAWNRKPLKRDITSQCVRPPAPLPYCRTRR